MEQRGSTRIPVDTRLMLAIPGFGLAPVRACNVSAGGACVQIAHPALAAGTLVQMVYVVRNGAGVMRRHVRALVVRVSGDCCGLIFTNLGPATFEMVDEMKRAGRRPPTTPLSDGLRIA
jgi:hypothetical protein